jgi:hypothetical protein
LAVLQALGDFVPASFSLATRKMILSLQLQKN